MSKYAKVNVPAVNAAAKKMNSKSLHSFLVPGMGALSCAEALEEFETKVKVMKEGKIMMKRVLDRFLQMANHCEAAAYGKKINDSFIISFARCVGQGLVALREHVDVPVIQRIATFPELSEGVKIVHMRIDVLSAKVSLSTTGTMSWTDKWDNDVTDMYEGLKFIVANTHVGEVQKGDPNFSMLLHKMEHDIKFKKMTPEETSLASTAIDKFKRFGGVITKEPQKVFLSPTNVAVKTEVVHIGTYGTFNAAKIKKTGDDIIIRVIRTPDTGTSAAMYEEAKLWSGLDHPNVMKLEGTAYMGSSMFHATSDVGRDRSLDKYLYKNKTNVNKFWRFMKDVVDGLNYLQCKGVIHNNINCGNLLVGLDGKVKLSDFSCSYPKGSTTNKNYLRKDVTSWWTAPEILRTRTTPPTTKGDMFSLGLCMIDIMVSQDPWKDSQKAKFKDAIVKGCTLIQPDEISDLKWKLILQLCKHNPEDRLSLEETLSIIHENAKAEEEYEIAQAAATKKLQEDNKTKPRLTCGKCGILGHGGAKFCGTCGQRY